MKPKAPKTAVSRPECRRRMAANLTRILAERQTSARALAREAGVCYRALQRAAIGESEPAGSLLISVAQCLGVTIEELLKPVKPSKKSRSSC